MANDNVWSLLFHNASKRRQNTEVEPSALWDDLYVEALFPCCADKSVGRVDVAAPFKSYYRAFDNRKISRRLPQFACGAIELKHVLSDRVDVSCFDDGENLHL